MTASVIGYIPIGSNVVPYTILIFQMKLLLSSIVTLFVFATKVKNYSIEKYKWK